MSKLGASGQPCKIPFRDVPSGNQMDNTAIGVVICAETRSKLLKRLAREKRDMLAMLRAVIPPVGNRRSWDRQRFSEKQDRIAYGQDC